MKYVLAILMIGVVLLASLSGYLLIQVPKIATSTTTETSISVVTTTTVGNITFAQVPSPCTVSYNNGSAPSSFEMAENSTIFLCVRLYYYNPNASETINPLSNFALDAAINGEFAFDNAMRNFSVTALPANLTMGGSKYPTQADVMYLIHSNPNSNGSYILDFGMLYPSMSACTLEYGLMVGDGIPNYLTVGGCIGRGVPSNSTYPFAQGSVYSEVMGSGNLAVY